jgi:TonB family protein
MKKLLLLAALCCLFAASRGQSADTVKHPPLPANGADPDNGGRPAVAEAPVYTSVSNPPHFPGGMDSLHRYLSKHLVYPPALLNAHKGGTVIISFAVETDGSLSQLQVRRSPGDPFSVEVLRVFSGMKWISGSQNGHAVRVMYTLPVRFDADMAGVF